MKRLACTLALTACITLALAYLGGTQSISASPGNTFTVNSPADVPDASPGNGVCDTGSGACTLRAAIQEANALGGADMINVPAITVTLTRKGAYDDTALNGDLDIASTLTIDGAGSNVSFIDGSGALTNDRVFHVLSGGRLTLSNLYVTNGRAYSTTPAYGGAVYVAPGGYLTVTRAWVAGSSADLGGAIFNNGDMTLNVSFVGYSSALRGGGIYNNGTMHGDSAFVFYNSAQEQGAGIFHSGYGSALSNASIYNNFAVSSSGVISAWGGAIYNASNFTLTNVSLSHNGADMGGGIFNTTIATLTVSNSLVFGNAALGGGGLANFGDVRAVGTLFKQNTAGFRGGAIYSGGADACTLKLTNSTLSGNTSNEAGGGLFHNGGDTSLYNVTIAFNVADDDNNDTSDGGGIKHAAGTVTIRNTLLANNIHRAGIGPLPDDCKGTLTSEGYNLIEYVGGCTVGGLATGNLTGQDPLLGALADNGGRTETHALGRGSIARDAGNPSGCTDALGALLATDQRGTLRPIDGNGDGVKRCDIGAFEALIDLFLPLIRR